MKELEQVILTKIKKGELKMKPKWRFEVVDKSIKGTFLAIVILGAMTLITIIYFVKEYNPVELAELGEVGRELFLTDFPYWHLLLMLMAITAAVVIVDKIGDNYKKTVGQKLMATIFIVGLFTGLLFLAW